MAIPLPLHATISIIALLAFAVMAFIARTIHNGTLSKLLVGLTGTQFIIGVIQWTILLLRTSGDFTFSSITRQTPFQVIETILHPLSIIISATIPILWIFFLTGLKKRAEQDAAANP